MAQDNRFDPARLEQIERRLQVLEDAEAIRNLKARYAALCDNQYDADGIVSLFTEDPVWESPNQHAQAAPQHGFARTTPWHLDGGGDRGQRVADPDPQPRRRRLAVLAGAVPRDISRDLRGERQASSPSRSITA